MNARLLAPLIRWSAAFPAQAAKPTHPIIAEKHRALFETYCVSCHGPEKQKGKVRQGQGTGAGTQDS
jgi:mono/diheme cytochrome c family protein